MNSTGDVAGNLSVAERLVRAAAADGATLVLLPEKWPLMASGEELALGAEDPEGPTMTTARSWARELGVWLVAGSVGERDPAGGDSPFNSSALIDPEGEVVTRYRKLHMFDVDVEGVSYRESDHERAGEEIVTARVGDAELGLSICYDLRFPELYRILALRGADVLTVPSAFTATTGRAHWEVLLRARAIENACFVLAANQCGEAPPQYSSFGHSMIVDPWGRIIAGLGADEEGFACADLDFAAQAEVRASIPALANRRGGAYVWPAEVGV
ncbi:carbon-nitrogen hydrolase family protein [soil metagenome]